MKIFKPLLLLGLLGIWTWVVVAAYNFGHFMSAAGDGASRRASGGYLPFIGIWIIPTILCCVVLILARRTKEAEKQSHEKKA